MGAYYSHLKPSTFDSDRVFIYKIKGSTKGSWYVRIKRAGKGKGYWTKGLDCTDERTAWKRAKQYWVEMLTADERGVQFGQTTFSKLFQEFLLKRNFKPDRRARIVHVFTRYFSEYFENMNVSLIDVEEFIKYINWRIGYWDRKEAEGAALPPNKKNKPSANTLKSERQILSQFLNFCKETHVINTVPKLPYDWESINVDVETKKSRGKPLSDKHHASIISKLYKYAMVEEWKAGMSGKEYDKKGKVIAEFKPDPMRYMTHDEVTTYARLRLYYFIVITGNLLLRQGTEATRLRFENIEHKVDPNDERKKYAVIRVLEGKKGRRDPVFTPYGRAYDQVVTWHLIAKSFGVGKPAQHVFGDLEGEYVPAHYHGRMHSRILKRWKLGKHSDGTQVTLYSYRHTAICRRIRKSGWDLIRVAKAANTSALAISTSYADEWMEADKERYTNTFRNPADLESVLDKSEKLQSDIDRKLEELGVV